MIDNYQLEVGKLIVNVDIFLGVMDFVPKYSLSVLNISPHTNIILEKLKQEFVTRVAVGTIQDSEDAQQNIQERFRREIKVLIDKYFPKISQRNKDLLISYVMRENIGLGNIEILLEDPDLEEIVINNSKDPIWVYHRKHGWLKTNVRVPSEARIRHYATMIGRDVRKGITMLEPLLDAHLKSGERVNATLQPISTKGNTITIRKFAEKPWTIVDFIKNGTMSYLSAALTWLVVQNEMSVLVAGGTATGKTSTLNVLCNFFPPNQRIISVEDTREVTLPDNLHWVPMETRIANPEGKGEVSMLDLVVNALRMRPDRIVVGEIRRKREAEVLFEAMHTGHSVYGTFHANDARETVARLTNPPIDVPKMLMPALSVILVQSRNRRTGVRRTFQLAEVTDTGDPHILYQYDFKRNEFAQTGKWTKLMDTLTMFTGYDQHEIQKDIEEKMKLLRHLVKNDVNDLHQLGLFFAMYYSDRLDINKLT